MAIISSARSRFSRLLKLPFLGRCFLHDSAHFSKSEASGYHLNDASSFMHGAVFWEPHKPLSIEEFYMPRPQAGEVLIKTKSCGVCHSDLHVMKGELPFASPCVLGHEVTGEVVEHGVHTDDGVIKRIPVGSRVVGAFVMPCGSCFYCVKGQEDLCEAFFSFNRAKGTLYDGETRLFLRSNRKPVYMYSMGGLAEYCVVPAHALSVLPEVLPFSESAVLGCAVFTAYGAMRHAADLRAGETVAVIGIGGVGSSCLQMCRAFGAATIVAIDVQEEKLYQAKMMGATHAINAEKENVIERIREITGGRGVDVAIEALGKPATFSQCVQSVRDGGKAVMVGLTSATHVGEVDVNRLVRRQIKIIGSYGARARQDLPAIIRLVEAGAIDVNALVSKMCKLEESNKAYEELDNRRIIGRAVVQMM